jgi:P pilus assembly chaperone PapD
MRWSAPSVARSGVMLLGAAVLTFSGAAHSEIVLSQLVVDLGSGQDRKADIEVWNNSDERAYVAAEPSEIVDAGKPGETRRTEADPEKRGLLVAPGRMILEPGQRRLIRLAPIGPRDTAERVYRLTVKPVAGALSAEETGLKLLIGYDVLVLLRPAAVRQGLTGTRSGKRLTVRNNGNASVELIDGRQCTAKTACAELPGKRLYAGAEWTQDLPSDAPANYVVVSQGRSERKSF